MTFGLIAGNCFAGEGVLLIYRCQNHSIDPNSCLQKPITSSSLASFVYNTPPLLLMRLLILFQAFFCFKLAEKQAELVSPTSTIELEISFSICSLLCSPIFPIAISSFFQLQSCLQIGLVLPFVLVALRVVACIILPYFSHHHTRLYSRPSLLVLPF